MPIKKFHVLITRAVDLLTTQSPNDRMRQQEAAIAKHFLPAFEKADVRFQHLMKISEERPWNEQEQAEVNLFIDAIEKYDRFMKPKLN
ncbi:MAG: hypothetical protein V1811_00280 [Candidatus Micrarchaeota archaeon]